MNVRTILSVLLLNVLLAVSASVLAQDQTAPASTEKKNPPAEEKAAPGEQKPAEENKVPPPANWKPAGEVTSPVPGQAGEGKATDGSGTAVQGGGESKTPAPPPENWKPAGEVTPPAPTAGAESKSWIPDPMIQYGSFTLSFHGYMQLLGGLVGSDSRIGNGDWLNSDGFRILRSRLGVAGQLFKMWTYSIEAELFDHTDGGNALAEALITFKPADYFWIQAGAGKPPYSRALLVPSYDMQFIERPIWVTMERSLPTPTLMLDLNHQVGVTVGGKLSYFKYTLGAYNGMPNFSVGNLHNGLLYVLRLEGGLGEMGESEADHLRTGPRFSVGVNGYINDAPAAQIRGAGADLGLKLYGFSFYAEAVWAKSVPVAQPESGGATVGETERWGMMAQAGYLLPLSFAEFELAVRFSIMDDDVHLADEGDLWVLTGGINAYFYGENLKLMLNYVLREELHGADLSNDGVFAMLQARF